MKKALILLTSIVLSLGHDAMAQYPMNRVLPYLRARGNNFNPKTEMWSSVWISVPGTNRQEYGVYYFRKEVNLSTIPSTYKVHVTADNRYKLYVNGTLLSAGPARSDFNHWKVSAIDLAPYLKSGKNVVAAMVCNYGEDTPTAMFSRGTGFLFMGEGEAKELNSDDSWMCIKDPAYSPIKVQLPTFFVAGPGETFDAAKSIKDWKDESCNMTGWQKAEASEIATPHDTDFGTGTYHYLLVENNLPEMERTPERLAALRKNSNTKIQIAKGWPSSQSDITIPANTDVTLLLDQQHLTNAYMNLVWSKGKGATLATTYAEALYSDPIKLIKQNRNNVDGLQIVGRRDSLISDGTDNQRFESLEWRTYRYVNLHIVTKDEPLVLNDIFGVFTGYPFKLKANLESSDRELQQMLEIGWRTQRLCAYETYMDCPYYEQMQYLGDTRIQALVTLFNTGDDIMVKNYLTQSDLSRNSEGCAQGRYPTADPQYITPYSLSYVYALHDYLMYCTDDAFLKNLMPGAEAILSYFNRYQQADGRLCNLPGWNFSDWVYVDGWQQGVAKRGADHCSALMDLQLLMGYNAMAELEAHFGNNYLANVYKEQASKMTEAIQKAYWDETRGLYADASDHKYFSQHAGALAILSGAIKGEAAKVMAQKLLTDETLAPCSVYYKFYLYTACIKAGLGEDYLSWLDIWRENIRQGLTTWAETSDIFGTRSDCHAWGASPSIEIYRTVLGVDSDAPGFARVRIEPRLSLVKADKKGNRIIGGNIPHPQGNIHVSYTLDKKGHLSAQVTLPGQVSGSFIWNGQTIQLNRGENSINL